MGAIECVIDSVRVHELTKQHTVLLKDRSSERVLPIWIDPNQAHSISARLYGEKSERPLTHDFVIDAFGKLGVEVSRVAVTGLLPQATLPDGQGIFLARVSLRADGRDIEVDCRPSDAIALAVRCGARIFVDESVFAAGSSIPERPPTL
ncbi:MAG: bifunctional nuclease family protein [Candidatus Limnocylindria bacterium]